MILASLGSIRCPLFRKSFLFLPIFVFLVVSALGQTYTVTGVVTDKAVGEPLIGVNVTYGEGMGTVTDIDGAFKLSLEKGEYELMVSYIGFEKEKRNINLNRDMFLRFELETITLNEVEVIGDLARTRETPVAFSNVKPIQIEEQLGSRDIPLILNATPGVYATQQGGGDGDARINIRGFNQRNVAVMLDGIPVNDMENGWVYWSNWFGLDVVMRNTQVQRGLGASKLAIPSVGGTINIMTKGIDAEKGMVLKQEVGNDGYFRTSLGLTTGRMKNGWGLTFAGSYKTGQGWVDQTWTEGFFYFLRLDKQLGNHVLSFTAMGAPQEHGQRSYQKHISTFDSAYAVDAGMDPGFINTISTIGVPTDMGLRYNPNWGYLSRMEITENDTIVPQREAESTAYNFYHKPMFSLRDFWSVNDKLYISNILYLSIGTGGGGSLSTSSLGFEPSTHQVNLQKVYNANLFSGFSSEIMRHAINNHFWTGLLSTFDYQINDNFNLSGGIDLRSYKGEHYREVADLLGGDYYTDDGNQNEAKDTKKYVGDKIGYYNDGLVRWGGLFAQLTYERGPLTTFVNLTGSYNGYKRIDYFIPKLLDVSDTTLAIGYGETVIYQGQEYNYNSPGLRLNESDWKWIPGFTLKGGANYNLSESMNVFANLGYMSKAQRFNNVFDYNNNLFEDIENEKVQAFELGYSFYQPRFTLNINSYLTTWKNKPADRGMTFIDPETGDQRRANINDMNALHKGIEFEFAYRIFDNLMFESLLSIGDWKWTSADTARIYDDNGQLVETRPFDAKGLYVGDAAQIQNRESLRWEIIKGLYATGVFTYFGKHFADFNPLDLNPEEFPDSFDENGNPRQSWEIPNYYTIDFHAGYRWSINKLGLAVRASILNLTDNKFITDAQNNDTYLYHQSTFDANSAGVFFGMGRRFNLSLKITL